MHCAAFKLWLDGEPAPADLMNRFIELRVDQQVDVAWQAELRVPICLDHRGNWSGASERFVEAFARLRLEIRSGDGQFVPVFEGPITEYAPAMSSGPGESVLVIRAYDDSIYLNRCVRYQRFEDRSDSDIVRQLFDDADHITAGEIMDTPAAPSRRAAEVAQTGTAMALLRRLARRHGAHVYVLPGDRADRSRGMFKVFTTGRSTHPTLTLVGPGRNMRTFSANADAERPATIDGAQLDVANRQIRTRTGRHRDVERLGNGTFTQGEQQDGCDVAPGHADESVDLDQLVDAETRRRGTFVTASGETLGHRYRGVLQPYAFVDIAGVNPRFSGQYRITQVTHVLSATSYAQSFRLESDTLGTTSHRASRDQSDIPASVAQQ